MEKGYWSSCGLDRPSLAFGWVERWMLPSPLLVHRTRNSSIRYQPHLPPLAPSLVPPV